MTPPVSRVTIDIKPGAGPNSFNAGSRGNIPVAILSTVSFDTRATGFRIGDTSGVLELRTIGGDGLMGSDGCGLFQANRSRSGVK